MELWIRSQDKEMLTKIDYIYLSVPTGKEVLGGNHYMINKSLGLYKTKERALEVLNDIQKILSPKGIIKFDCMLSQETMQQVKNHFKEDFIVGDNRLEKIELADSYVYEMPKE